MIYIMASKTISVTEEVFNLLKNVKLKGESFGDTIKRLCEEKIAKSLVEWVKNHELWENMPDDEFAEFKSTISRKTSSFTVFGDDI